MQLAALRAFHAVAVTGGFRRAGDLLHVTQPAVTAQVKALEEAHGIELFRRTGRGVMLSELGQELFEASRRALGMIDDLEEILRSAGRLDRGTLRIGADSPFAAMPLLRRFMAHYPAIGVRAVMGNTAEALASVREGEADVAVLTLLDHDREGLAVQTLVSDRIVLVAPADHAWAGRQTVPLAALDGIAMIARETGSGTRAVLDAALAAAGASPRVVMEFGSREALREAVAAGLGLGAMFAHEAGHDARLTSIPLLGDGLDAATCLVCRAERRSLRVIRALFTLATAPS